MIGHTRFRVKPFREFNVALSGTPRARPLLQRLGPPLAPASGLSTLGMTERIGGEHVEASPLRGLPEATAIRRQLRRREAGWDGSL